jgi:hypothetical protein
MQIPKKAILPILGLLILIGFCALSYYHEQIFLDKILLCGFILGMILFVKIRGEFNNPGHPHHNSELKNH